MTEACRRRIRREASQESTRSKSAAVSEAESRAALRGDLSAEYFALVDLVAGFDGRLLVVKGWSVTLSLAGLGLGFQQGHYALFALAALSAAGFWLIDAIMKRHQMRYYARMRDIEVAASQLNGVELEGWRESSQRIDWYWSYDGDTPDWRHDPPRRHSSREIASMLRLAPWMPHVLLPHAVAVVLGAVLFLLAALDAAGLDSLVL